MRVLLIDQIAKTNFKYSFPLANGLEKNGAKVTLVLDQKSEKENSTCEIINLFTTDEKNIGKIKKVLNYLKSYIRIGKILKKGNYDVIHTQWYIFSPVDYYFLSKYKKKYGVKIVSTVHDILPFNEKFYDKFFHDRLYKIADKIILQAPSNMGRFKDIFPAYANKTIMIPHGHTMDYVQVIDKVEARKYLGLDLNKKIFLFFGQIKKVKGVDILLQAFANVKTNNTDVLLVIAGSVWKTDFSRCEEIIQEYSLQNDVVLDIRFIPEEDIKYYYSASDICMLPYTDVYQSGVIQLAYGYQKPVIATELPAFTQFVKEGETGYLAKVKDVDSLAAAMEKAIDSSYKWEEMGKNGHDYIKKTLGWEDITKSIVKNCYMDK